MPRPIFNTDFEYEEWVDKAQGKRILDDYFGEEIKKDGRSNDPTN